MARFAGAPAGHRLPTCDFRAAGGAVEHVQGNEPSRDKRTRAALRHADADLCSRRASVVAWAWVNPAPATTNVSDGSSYMRSRIFPLSGSTSIRAAGVTMMCQLLSTGRIGRHGRASPASWCSVAVCLGPLSRPYELHRLSEKGLLARAHGSGLRAVQLPGGGSGSIRSTSSRLPAAPVAPRCPTAAAACERGSPCL